MSGIIDGIKWGILLQLGVAVILPAVMPMIGKIGGSLGGQGQQGHQGGGRPFGYEGDW